EVIPSFDWMTVDGGDDVAALQSGLLCGAAGLHGLNHYPVWRSEGFQGNGVRADLFLEADADRTTGHPALLDDLVVHLNRHGRRKRKAHTFVAAVAGDNGRVDANHLACKIDQWDAGVAGLDGRVGLQESLELLANAGAVLGADDVRCDRVLQSKGAANRQIPVANLHAV